MKLVFLLEERSMEALLQGILQKILPEGVDYIIVPHSGKSELEKSIPVKLRGWNEPNVKFVILHDQDSNDCITLKQNLRMLCNGYGKECLIRIPCHELEAWYFGDLAAVSTAFNVDLTRLASKKKYRDPDAIINPKKELQKLLPSYGQIDGARRIAEHMDVEANRSKSFNVFVSGVRKFASEK